MSSLYERVDQLLSQLIPILKARQQGVLDQTAHLDDIGPADEINSPTDAELHNEARILHGLACELITNLNPEVDFDRVNDQRRLVRSLFVQATGRWPTHAMAAK